MIGVEAQSASGLQRPYNHLKRLFHEIGLLRSISGTLNWDAAVNLPPGGRRLRSDQLALIDAAIYDRLSANRTRDLLAAALEMAASLERLDRINLDLMGREIGHVTAVPKGLSSALVRAQADCEGVWAAAKPESDFAAVAPLAAEVLNLTRQVSVAKSRRLGLSPQEALIDYWDPGTSLRDFAGLFAPLKARLPEFIDRIERLQSPDRCPIMPAMPAAIQLEVCSRLARDLGYDFDHGRIDQSAQAFFVDDCPEDVRITTRPDPDDYRSAVFGILHEIGHSFYERALPRDWLYQPIGRPASAGMQESQSLLFEKLIGRHPAFLAMIAGQMKSATGDPGPSPEHVSQHLRRVERTPIRTDADEVTYPLHVIIRCELEAELVSGALDFTDLPSAWHEAYRDLLGVTPKSDREGCLQDIHWYRGLYGYFQSYVLGSLISAQLLEAARSSSPEIDAGLSRTDLSSLRSWLQSNIYCHGRAYSALQLVTTATGKPLSVEPLMRHYEQRYVARPHGAH
ncbi:MAG: carboxypeptidase M32 [Pseudomonadota bacterium]